MSTNQSHLAVQLPEIVSHILFYIAPYSDPDSKQYSVIHRYKRHLIPCLLINRLWHECALRHLWRHVIFENTSDVVAFHHFASVLSNQPITKPVATSLSSIMLSSLSISSSSSSPIEPDTYTSSKSLVESSSSSSSSSPSSSLFLYRKSLQSLTLRRIKGKEIHESIVTLAPEASRLQRLEIYICDHVTNSTLIPFFFDQSPLTHVSLAGCHQISDESILVLARHVPGLVHLDLRACGLISDVSLTAIAQSCPQLHHLNVGRIREKHRVTSQSIIKIAHLTQVTVLGLAGCEIEDDAIEALVKYRQIERVSVNDCKKLTNRAIRCLLPSCTQLSVFEMKECRIDDWAVVDRLVERKVSLTMNDDQKYAFQAWSVRYGRNSIVSAPVK
ncbi:hypothetical protein BC941DRAFT_348634 [Chlamydoabsidia padenii]|nr:hypothetical protein BC941DRAFT_348634 [Chlamydoabsidia padenii]